jgi:hypothetical protein
MLMYDVNDPKTLEALTKWWHEFKDRAPLRDEDVAEFCCVVVGNKMDLVPTGELPTVMEGDAVKFMEGICPGEEPEVNVSPTSPWRSPRILGGDLVARTVTEWVHRHFRQQNSTAFVSKRALRVKIEIAPPRWNCIVDTNCTFDLSHSFVILVRELRIREVLTYPWFSLPFTSTRHPTIAHVRKLGQA